LNRRSISHGSRKDVQNYEIKGNNPNCSGYRIRGKYVNGDNLNNIRNEANRHFRNKKGQYFKKKSNGLVTHSKNRNIREIYR
jgi:hypothetical protein